MTRGHAEDDVVDQLGEDAAETEHHAGPELGVPGQAADQLPVPFDHLLHEEGFAAGNGQEPLRFLPDLPLRFQVQGNGPQLRLVLELLPGRLEHHGIPQVLGRLDGPRLIGNQDLPADRDPEFRQKAFGLVLVQRRFSCFDRLFNQFIGEFSPFFAIRCHT